MGTVILILSLILSFIGSLTGWERIVLQSKRLLTKTAYNRLLHVRNGILTVIVTPTQDKKQNDLNVASTVEDFKAQECLENMLNKNDIDHISMLHHDFTDSYKHNNLFLICGPVGNSVTKQLIDKCLALPFKFVHTERGWAIEGQDGYRWHTDSDKMAYDFGVLICMPNPWARPERRSKVFITAGIRGLGTWGAAHYLSERGGELYQRLQLDTKFGGEVKFAGLIKAQDRGTREPPIAKLLEIEYW